MFTRPSIMALSICCSWSAAAAEVTDVPDALVEGNPIDVQLSVPFQFTYQRALFTREAYQVDPNDPSGPPRSTTVNELDYQRFSFVLKPRLEVGVFHDLSLFTEWPITLWDAQDARYAPGTNADNSTLNRDRNSTDPATTGIDGWGNSGRIPDKEYTDWRGNAEGVFQAYRRGIDNPRFGLRFSPITQLADDTKPTVTLQVDYTAPFFAFMNPTNDVLSLDNPGAVGQGLHVFHGSMAVSRRVLILEPYALVEAFVPFAGTNGTFQPGLLTPFPTGMHGGFAVGTEFVPFEDTKLKQRVAFLVEGNAHYFSEARNYSEASDFLKQLTQVEQFARIGARVNVQYHAFDIVKVAVGGTASYDTSHVLTNEEFGKDGADADNEEVNLSDPTERNPYFNPALDAPGRRLRVENNFQVAVQLQLTLTL
jgi:hypothetical protein